MYYTPGKVGLPLHRKRKPPPREAIIFTGILHRVKQFTLHYKVEISFLLEDKIRNYEV